MTKLTSEDKNKLQKSAFTITIRCSNCNYDFNSNFEDDILEISNHQFAYCICTRCRKVHLFDLTNLSKDALGSII